jgi:hypothetical protein
MPNSPQYSAKKRDRTAIRATRQPHSRLVILSEAKDLLFALGCPTLTSCFSTLEPALSEAEGVGFHRCVKLGIFLGSQAGRVGPISGG